jgi:aminopeptidase N
MSQDMKASHKKIYLKDYQPPQYFVDRLDLDIDLFEDHSIVKAQMKIHRNNDVASSETPLVLHGHHMELQSLLIDGQAVSPELSDHDLRVKSVPESFELSSVVRIKPQNNKALEGLYKSDDLFVTQCEAEGFRRITYFVDRPDNMSLYTTTLRADKKKYPILLSNGNKVKQKDLPDGRHEVTWHDPFRKPSYLFAAVAGDLDFIEDQYTTQSGRKVGLEIYVDKGQTGRATFAMEALKKSMRWDEFRYGLEYDLDIYMIVAVNAFNMGAMENKGLNVFNSRYVLADAETDTDQDYINIDSVIGHEYFHNWTGNRVTCRDWFQLSLKEGLTVYRDQEFTSDHFSRAVCRINYVNRLRSYQFQEDAGPNAHPVLPKSCVSVDNFYTTTIYEKGAEVIRMIEQVIGRDLFRKGIDKYFSLFDGQAVTIEDFVHAMEVASGYDFSQFKRWYHQVGTPTLKMSRHYDSREKTYHLKVQQNLPQVEGADPPQPMLIPLKVGLIGSDGQPLPLKVDNTLRQEDPFNATLNVNQWEQEFVFKDVEHEPTPSLLRDFSAPVNLEIDQTDKELTFLMQHDRNEFNRWEAGQSIFIKEFEKCKSEGKSYQLPDQVRSAFIANLVRADEDPWFTSRMLQLPQQEYLKQLADHYDPQLLIKTLTTMEKVIGKACEEQLLKTYAHHHKQGEYKFTETDASHRFLKNLCLYYLSATDEEDHLSLAAEQFQSSKNMTDQKAALRALNNTESTIRDNCFTQFYDRWAKDPVVFVSYLGLQSTSRRPTTLDKVKELTQDKHFDKTMPNHVRALIGGLSHNLSQFHPTDGSSYEFFTDTVIDADKFNPQLASSLAGAYDDWKKLSDHHQGLIKTQLKRILSVDNLSNNTYEIVSRALR